MKNKTTIYYSLILLALSLVTQMFTSYNYSYYVDEELGIDKPNLPMEEDVWEYTQSIVNVSKEDIKNEIIEYLDLLM